MISTDQDDGGAAHSLTLFDGPGRPVSGPEPLADPVYAYIDSLSPASQEAVWKRLRTVARLFDIAAPRPSPGTTCAPPRSRASGSASCSPTAPQTSGPHRRRST